MNRRSFLGGLAALVGGIAVAEAIPLGRVWSFPSKIVPLNVTISQYSDYISLSDLNITYYDSKMIENLKQNLVFDEAWSYKNIPEATGETIRMYA